MRALSSAIGSDKQPIVIATGNPHKVEELRQIFSGAGLQVLGLQDLPGSQGITEPVEHGTTFEENARIKALEYARQTGRICLADDSGLEVDALGGFPGVISSHFASGGAETGLSRGERDEANNRRLLRELEHVERESRLARFVCVMVLAAPPSAEGGPQVLLISRGVFEGMIGEPGEVPRGSSGFGYDPLFVLEDGRTAAELSAQEKNARSHRGMAAREMARQIAAALQR